MSQTNQSTYSNQQELNQTMNDTIKEPTQFDLNSIFISALSQAITQATAPLTKRIQELEEKIQAGEERIKDIAEEVAREVLSEHNDLYDHDGYDRLEERIEEKVNEAIDDLDISDKINDALNGATVSISV
jgi:predicted nuclease with TOPRIM domain